MAERYGCLPHELMTGVRDVPGVRLQASLFKLDLLCYDWHNKKIEEERKRAEDAAKIGGWNR